MSFEQEGGVGTLAIVMEPKVNEYLSLVMKLIFAFGLSFQLPVVLMLMARAGMVTSKGLAEKRKFAVVLTFAAAAVLTPPDVISQVGLGIPILLLYEISIIGTKMVEKKRAEREASEEEDIT
jgi:sec-independent protein translocase protein TatC